MKNSRKLLVSSLIMIISFCLLFAGTTFAWFSDSITSSNNIITAGNLDVELEYSLDAEAWQAVENDKPILPASDLWEPGFTRVVYFRIKNAGSLALKYSFNVNIKYENSAINVMGKKFYLSTFLKYGKNIGTAQVEKLANRDAYAALSTAQLEAKNVLANERVLPSKGVEYGWFAITMPTTVGNEANTKPYTTAPSIELGFDLFATQVNADITNVPVANVNKEADTIVLDSNNTMSGYQPTKGSAELEAYYSFKTVDTAEQGAASPYAEWHADFVVSFDKDVEKGAGGLAGQYTEWSDDWLVFENTNDVISANTPIRLLELYGLTINYEELCSIVKEFKCGAYDINNALAGTTLTVELRLYEASSGTLSGETGEYISIGKYSHTFTNETNSAEEINAILGNGGSVLFDKDVIAPLSGSAIYGTPVAIQQKNGGIIDGNGNSLYIENPQFAGYAIETYGGTIKNLTITTAVGRGIVISSPKEDIYIENVVVDGPGYAINTTEHSAKKLIVTNSTINGWTSLAGLEIASFANCSFGENSSKYWQNNGYDQDYDRLIRPYVNATFTDCTFEQGYYIDLSALGAGCKITLTNCVVNGVKLTAENCNAYITVELPSGRTLAECVVFA